jgi:hypothetical protein
MTDLNTSEAADDHAPPSADDTNLSRMLDPKSFEAPPAEKSPTFGSDSHGLKQAADELRERRGKPEPTIKQRRLADDAPKTLSAKNAAERLAFNRGADRALQRVARNPGENAWVSGNIVRQEMDAENEPSVVEYQNKEKGERVNAREAARDLAEYRRTTAPQEAEALDARRKLLAELGALDLVQPETVTEQTPEAVTEQPAEQPAQPEQQLVDPVAQARHEAAAYLQATQQLHGLTQAEVLAHAQLRTAAQAHASEFSDVRSYDDLARLSPERQQRFVGQQQVLRTAVEQFQNLSAQRQLTQQQIEAARQAEQDQAFRAYKTEQDALAASSIPEISGDPETAYAFGRAATEALAEYGITRDAIRTYSPDVIRAMNSASFQRLVADATRYRQGKARAKEVSAQPLPPVQRPGVARDRGERQQVDVSHLSERIDRLRPGSDKQLRAAASLIATRRANRGR